MKKLHTNLEALDKKFNEFVLNEDEKISTVQINLDKKLEALDKSCEIFQESQVEKMLSLETNFTEILEALNSKVERFQESQDRKVSNLQTSQETLENKIESLQNAFEAHQNQVKLSIEKNSNQSITLFNHIVEDSLKRTDSRLETLSNGSNSFLDQMNSKIQQKVDLTDFDEKFQNLLSTNNQHEQNLKELKTSSTDAAQNLMNLFKDLADLVDEKFENFSQIIQNQKIELAQMEKQRQTVDETQDIHQTSLWGIAGIILLLLVATIVCLIKYKMNRNGSKEKVFKDQKVSTEMSDL